MICLDRMIIGAFKMHRREGEMIKTSPHQLQLAHNLVLIHILQLLHRVQMLLMFEDMVVPVDEGEVVGGEVSLLLQENLLAILLLTLVVSLMYGDLLLTIHKILSNNLQTLRISLFRYLVVFTKNFVG